MKKLGIISSIFDNCLLFNNNIITIIDLQTKDSLIVDIIEFMNIKSRELYVVDLMIKLCERFTSKQLLNFNNFVITLDSKSDITIS